MPKVTEMLKTEVSARILPPETETTLNFIKLKDFYLSWLSNTEQKNSKNKVTNTLIWNMKEKFKNHPPQLKENVVTLSLATTICKVVTFFVGIITA